MASATTSRLRGAMYHAAAVALGFGAIGAVGIAVALLAGGRREPVPLAAIASGVPLAIAAPPEDPMARAARLAAPWRLMSAAERRAAVVACYDATDCPTEKAQAIADAAGDVEHADLKRLSSLLYARNGARAAKDGPDVAEAALLQVAMGVDGCGMAELRTLPVTSYAEAMKDAAEARGKVIAMDGTIVQITKDKAVFRGTATTPIGNPVYFITPGRTDGILAGSRAKFLGIFVQRFAYPNVLGGSTEAPLMVGRFVGQSENPIEPPPTRRGNR